MLDGWQYVLVWLVVTVAALHVGWRIVTACVAWRRGTRGCAGCAGGGCSRSTPALVKIGAAPPRRDPAE